MKPSHLFSKIADPLSARAIFVFLLLFTVSGCQKDEPVLLWDVKVRVAEQFLIVKATIADYHGDFIHMSIRKKDWNNDYSIVQSPAPDQPERDWSRVHRWFGEMNTNTYLEGRIDDGSGEGPPQFTTYRFKLPRNKGLPRNNYEDQNGSDYQYITEGYGYADGHYRHPGFPAGQYEVELYPWYTGQANNQHPSTNGKEGVQYLHYEQPLSSTTFVIQ